MKATTLNIIILFISLSITAQYQREKISFESANPFSLSDIILRLEKQEKQKVFGQLTIPVDSLNLNKKHPLIIGVAGSFGWRKHHLDYMKMYQELGFATFELNSFKSRDITTTVGSQDEVTIAAVILDAYRALEKLASHPSIDIKKVAITGWSLGGGVSLFSAWLPLKKVITNKYSFAAHLAFYPPCFVKPVNLEFSMAPIQIMIGEKDNWTPAAPCKSLVSNLKEAANIDIEIYPNSHHGFDSGKPLVRNEKGYSFKNCLFELTTEGDILMNYLKLPMNNAWMQKLGFLFCVERGVDIGGNPKAREQSFLFASEFMKSHLKK